MNIFFDKKILIYGLGKSGLSAYRFLKNKNNVFLYDDFKIINKIRNIKKDIIDFKKLKNSKFDRIIISPGIDINNCKLSSFLRENKKIIYTDLDVFFEFYKNDCITITGTNGKSTTCQILYKILLDQNYDVKLVGNIGNPILSVKNVKKKTFFIVEASSYQLEYSKIFKSKYSIILNLSPDHIERHNSLQNYIKAKFRLLKNQSRGDYAFVKKNDALIDRMLKKNKYPCKIIKVDSKKIEKSLKNFDNNYFQTESNRENLSFALEISKKFNLKKNILIKTIQNFKGLKHRQQIIFKDKYLTIINDSKSTSFSSATSLLENYSNVYWLLGGIFKIGDNFHLSKKYYNNIRAFIYGNNKNFFNKKLDGKIEYENFSNLNQALKKIFKIITKKKTIKKTILFSPCAASFDTFKNFEERGDYFEGLIKRYLNEL